jgi:hypothetical protein
VGHPAVVELEVVVEIGLELVQTFAEGLAESHGKDLFFYGAVESFAEAVGLRRANFVAAVFDLVQGQREFVEVLGRLAAILVPIVGKDALGPGVVLLM